MHLLILGGTQFVGRHIVLTALARGHTVTTFTRGRTADDLPPEVERLHGDRDGDLAALQDRDWDACVDVSGYLPRVVRQSAELLRDRVGRYLFISTVSVYADSPRDATDEDSPLIELPDPTVEQVTGETYGGLKVLCERVVQELYGERATILRPHVVAGPFDHTGRYTHWPERLARAAEQGGEVLAPGDGQDFVQYIDARDLAEFTLHLLEQGTPGVFNGVGPSYRWADFLAVVARAVGARPDLTWVAADFLAARGLGWSQLPLYLSRAEDAGTMRCRTDRAEAAGLRHRDLEVTARDTLAWSRSSPARPPADPARTPAPLSPEREAGVLAEWHGRQG